MKLQRLECEFIESENGIWVEWSRELQEAWDKQQEMKVAFEMYDMENTYGEFKCPSCNSDHVMSFSDKLMNYCGDCGQKIKY